MGSPVSRAPREELGKDSDNKGTESEAEGSEPERPMPMTRAAPKAAPKGKAKAPWRALQAAIKQGDYRVLCKSGEKCLHISWGPVRFVDSMNVFPTSMIDDLRACTHKQLPELFPLMASLHCILRKLPMPFQHFCGAKAWEMVAVWEQHCYDSVLAGKAVSAEDWPSAPHGVGDLPQVPRLLPPHRRLGQLQLCHRHLQRGYQLGALPTTATGSS